MYVLWTNYDIKDSYRVFQITATWWKVKEFMDEVMNEGLPSDSERSESLWWWASDNDFVSFKTLVFSIGSSLTSSVHSVFKPHHRVRASGLLRSFHSCTTIYAVIMSMAVHF